jgi:hypothetical protein
MHIHLFEFSDQKWCPSIPIVPIATIWDGLVSILRMYTPKEMLKMASETGAENYEWTAGEIKGKFANIVMYISGYPKA